MNVYASAIRLAAVGLDSPRSEALPWTGGSVSVAVVDSAGSAVSGSPFAAARAAGRWAYTLPALDDLDTLTETWSRDDERYVIEVQVRGGDPFPLVELDRRLESGSETSVTTYPDWLRRIALAESLLALERSCETALVPKRSTVKIRGRRAGDLVEVDHPNVLAVVGTTAAGVDPEDCEVLDDGTVQLPFAAWPPFTITVDHGERGPQPDVARAVAGLAALVLQDGPWDERGFAQIESGTFMRMLTAGINGAEFSLPDAEAVYKRHRMLTIG